MAQGGEAAWELICQADEILVPGGFGDRRIDGKINALGYCRQKKNLSLEYSLVCKWLLLKQCEVYIANPAQTQNNLTLMHQLKQWYIYRK